MHLAPFVGMAFAAPPPIAAAAISPPKVDPTPSPRGGETNVACMVTVVTFPSGPRVAESDIVAVVPGKRSHTCVTEATASPCSKFASSAIGSNATLSPLEAGVAIIHEIAEFYIHSFKLRS